MEKDLGSSLCTRLMAAYDEQLNNLLGYTGFWQVENFKTVVVYVT